MPRKPSKHLHEEKHPAEKLPLIDLRNGFGKLIQDYAERIQLVSAKYGFSVKPTPWEWKGLAVALMVAHERAMKIIPGQVRDEPNLREFAAIGYASRNGKKMSVYAATRKLYPERMNALRTAHSRDKRLTEERRKSNLPDDPRGCFQAALLLALIWHFPDTPPTLPTPKSNKASVTKSPIDL